MVTELEWTDKIQPEITGRWPYLAAEEQGRNLGDIKREAKRFSVRSTFEAVLDVARKKGNLWSLPVFIAVLKEAGRPELHYQPSTDRSYQPDTVDQRVEQNEIDACRETLVRNPKTFPFVWLPSAKKAFYIPLGELVQVNESGTMQRTRHYRELIGQWHDLFKSAPKPLAGLIAQKREKSEK